MNIAEFLANASSTLEELKALAKSHQEYTVKRNDAGNFAFFDASGRHLGYVDFSEGWLSVPGEYR